MSPITKRKGEVSGAQPESVNERSPSHRSDSERRLEGDLPRGYGDPALSIVWGGRIGTYTGRRLALAVATPPREDP